MRVSQWNAVFNVVVIHRHDLRIDTLWVCTCIILWELSCCRISLMLTHQVIHNVVFWTWWVQFKNQLCKTAGLWLKTFVCAVKSSLFLFLDKGEEPLGGTDIEWATPQHTVTDLENRRSWHQTGFSLTPTFFISSEKVFWPFAVAPNCGQVLPVCCNLSWWV